MRFKERIIFYHSLIGMLLVVFLSCNVAFAEITARECERIASELSQTIKTCPDLAKQSVWHDMVFRRDPMQSLIDEKGNLTNAAGLHEGLALQGFVWSREFSVALIDDMFFSQGDKVGPYKILEIRNDGLVAERDKQVIFVPLYRESETGRKDLNRP